MDTQDGTIKLITEVIQSITNIEMSVLMGANIAKDVASEDFCEATIGSRSEEQGAVLRTLFNRPTFKVNVVADVAAVELCGALKVKGAWLVGVVLGAVLIVFLCLLTLYQNIVAVAAGFSDGLR